VKAYEPELRKHLNTIMLTAKGLLRYMDDPEKADRSFVISEEVQALTKAAIQACDVMREHWALAGKEKRP